MKFDKVIHCFQYSRRSVQTKSLSEQLFFLTQCKTDKTFSILIVSQQQMNKFIYLKNN